MGYENFRTEKDFENTPVLVIVSMYNSMTGKNIKAFHTRSKGIEQTIRAVEAKYGSKTNDTVTTKKVKTPKQARGTTTTKPKGTSGKRGRKPINRPDQIISMQTEENHKRANTWAEKQFALLLKCDGKTVEKFLALEGTHPSMKDRRPGWAREELAYAVRRGYVLLEDAP